MILTSGCATLIKGNNREVAVDSEPRGSKVYVDGRYNGVTPTTVSLNLVLDRYLTLEHSGYEPLQYELQKQVTPLYYTNILFPWGFGIDALTKSGWDFVPSPTIHLQPGAAAEEQQDFLAHYRIPETTARQGECVLVIFMSKSANANLVSLNVLVEGASIGSLRAGGVLIARVLPGRIEVKLRGNIGEKLAAFSLSKGETVYLQASLVATEPVSLSTTYYAAFLELLSEEEAVREVFYLLRPSGLIGHP